MSTISNPISPKDKSTCFICLDKLEGDYPSKKLQDCIHRFHKVCIETWLKNSNVCPQCNTIQKEIKQLKNEPSGSDFKNSFYSNISDIASEELFNFLIDNEGHQ